MRILSVLCVANVCRLRPFPTALLSPLALIAENLHRLSRKALKRKVQVSLLSSAVHTTAQKRTPHLMSL